MRNKGTEKDKENIKSDENFELNSSTKKIHSDKLLKRARSKYFTSSLMRELLKIDSELHTSYLNTLYCNHSLTQADGHITGHYCKNRWCIICSRIRTSQNILKYGDEIRSWGTDKYFVTLTIKNIPGIELHTSIDRMMKQFSLIVRSINRKVKFIAIRKLETTHNQQSKEFHPHFHCIVKGRDVAEMLKEKWLERFPSSESYCQDIRQANDDTMKELFKYFSKIMTSKTGDGNQQINIQALDTIFLSVRNRRTFQAYGFEAKDIPDFVDEVVDADGADGADGADEVKHYIWDFDVNDWICKESGECLTGYVPADKMKELLSKIDVDSG